MQINLPIRNPAKEAGEMVQWVKGFTTKLGDLSLIPTTHLTEEGET